jgi:hypothetical protein
MHSINVISYNMGTNIRDFAWECEYLKQKIAEDDLGQQLYKEAQENTTKSLVGRASVYLLQEVDREDRPLIDSLKMEGCAIFHILNNPNGTEKTRMRGAFDCAIVLKMEEFETIENYSKMINGYDMAMVTATHKLTKGRMTFVSGHVPGFKLEDEEFFQADLRDGDKYCQTMIDEISALKDSTIHIIGADMNSNPEVMEKINKTTERKWRHRFEKFGDAGFETCRTGKSTNVKPDSDYCKRELDFIFVRSISLKSIDRPERLLKWDSSLNASDHRPILAKFQ